MAMTIKEIRLKHPDYNDLSDIELADKLHSKFYSDLPKEEIYKKLGVNNSSVPPTGMQEETQEEQPEPQESGTTGLLGVASDAGDLFRKALSHGMNFLNDIPKMTEDLGQELLEHPGTGQIRGLGQIGASAAESGKSVFNAPHDLFKYLQKKNLAFDIPIPGTKWHTSDLIPHIPEDTGVENALGLTPRKGDRLLRAIPDVVTAGGAAKSLLKAGKKALTAPSKETLFKRALEEGIKKAEEKHNLDKGDLKGLEDSLRLKYSDIHNEKLGGTTPVSMKENINVKQGKVEALKASTEIPEKHVGEIPPEPDTKAIVDKKKSALEKARKAAEDTLGILDNPNLKGGAKVKKAIEDVKKSSSDLYNSARSHYVDKKIMADNSKEIKDVTSDLEAMKEADELAPGYGSGTAEQKSLESRLKSLKDEKVNASDIFDLQRSLEQMAENTRKKQFASGKGITEIERNRLGELADRFDSHAQKLAQRLETVGGKEVQGMIKEANKGWKTYKDLQKRNPVGKAALKGEIPSRTLIEIHKDHPGNDFLQALVNADPELKKHVLATFTGESNVTKLMKPTSLTKKYLESLPDVEEHVNALKNALADVKQGETQASKIKKEYQALKSSMEDAAKEQKVRQDAIKQSDKLKRQIKFIEESIPKVEAKMNALDKSGAEHARLKEQLESHKKNLEDKNHLLKKATSIVLKFTGASSLLHKIGL